MRVSLTRRVQMSLCLTKAELVELTGWKRKKTQAKWLDEQGISYWIGGDGSPRVLRESILPKDMKQRRTKPNFDALNGQTQKTPSRAA